MTTSIPETTSETTTTTTSNDEHQQQQQQQQQQQYQLLLEQVDEWKTKGNGLFSSCSSSSINSSSTISTINEAIEAYTQGIIIADRIEQMLTLQSKNNGTPTTSSGIASTVSIKKHTLLSNRAMCYLKKMSYQDCIDDCTQALDEQRDRTNDSTATATSNKNNNDNQNAATIEQLRTKLLFRRAKAKFMQSNSNSNSSSSNNSTMTPMSYTACNNLLQEAAKDLLALLQMDPTNKDGNQLLATVRTQHKQMTAASNTPVSKTINAISDAINNSNKNDMETDYSQCFHHVKILLGLLENDIVNVSMELGRIMAIPVLLNVARMSFCTKSTTSSSTATTSTTAASKLPVLAVRCISIAASYPQFVRTFLVHYQTDLTNLIQQVAATPLSNTTGSATSETIVAGESTMSTSIQIRSDLIVSILSCWVRLILHVDRDDPNKDITGDTKQNYNAIIDTIHCALKCCTNYHCNTTTTITTIHDNDTDTDTTLVLRAILDLVGTWTCGTDRDANIRLAIQSSSSGSGMITDPTVPVQLSAMEIHQFTPHQLADYRKRQILIKKRDIQWAMERCTKLIIETNIFQLLLSIACSSYDSTVRREATITIGKLLACFNEEDERLKEIATPFLQDTTTNNKIKEKQRPMIEEIVEEVYNDDGEIVDDDGTEEAKSEAVVVPTLYTKMERAMVACSMLLTANREIGSWALSTGWDTSITDLPDLIRSEDIRAMGLASEVASAAATNEAARNIVIALVSNGDMETLLLHPDRDIRSGAASAVAKLGLAQQSDKDDSEYMSMLTGACELLMDHNDNDDPSNASNEEKRAEKKSDKNNKSSSNGINHFSSFATSSVERGVEMMTYLMSNTNVKEEICDGFTPISRFNTSNQTPTALELLVRTATDTPGIGESLTGFGLASIFRNMSATNQDLRALMFEGKDFTMEQYDEMQRLQKTEEERELMETQQSGDIDTTALKYARIRKMVSASVPRALVSLTENASEHTLEQIAFCMSQMADEKSIRGSMIQQGLLSSCIKLETKEGPVETDTMKNVLRLCRHTISKLLITTNPSLLTSAQRLGSVKPLLRLVRDSHAKDLHHFEALMALTNIGATGEDAKNRIVVEKGIPAMHFAMFSNHEMVRRAATEAMSNLVPHEAMTEHLLQVDNLRLWLAFAEDYENENYECARAASGCLAMITQQNLEIGTLLVTLPKFQDHITNMLESGRLEIMHRTFCIVLNLVEYKNDVVMKKLREANVIIFCRAYIENYLRNGTDGLEFPESEKPLLPIVLDLAKKIVKIADPV